MPESVASATATMKTNSSIPLAALAFTALTLQVHAGGKTAAASKNPEPAADYEGGRGLLTLEGPSGMFINPTSGTLPAHAFTAQYCFLLPNNDTSPLVAHGAMMAYGVTDWLELGALLTVLDFDQGVAARQADLYGVGPLVRVRLLKDDGLIPQLSVGAYFNFGDLETYNAFLALYKRVEIDRNGFLRSIGFHAGMREKWIAKGGDVSDTPVGYFGVEFQLPARFYVVGEVSTKDRDTGGNRTPYGFGVQWRAGGINVSAAFTNNGAFREPSFFFGIGSQLKF